MLIDESGLWLTELPGLGGMLPAATDGARLSGIRETTEPEFEARLSLRAEEVVD